MAFVVAEPGAAPDALDRDALRGWCRERIADYKAPDRVVVVDDLPVTPMHKIDKRALDDRLDHGALAERAQEKEPTAP